VGLCLHPGGKFVEDHGLNELLYPAENGRPFTVPEILEGEEVAPWEGAEALYAELAYILEGGENLRAKSSEGRCASATGQTDRQTGRLMATEPQRAQPAV
jgi:hypothetical protein